MAKPPRTTKLKADDFKTLSKEEGDLLTTTVNSLAEDVASAMDKRLTVQENLNAQVKTVTYTPQASATSVTFSSLSSRPIGVLLLEARDTNSPNTAVSVTGMPAWSYSGGQVTISSVPGLTNGTKYTLTFLVLGG